jgi:predicted enzyme related to lactoylglutathione lyase
MSNAEIRGRFIWHELLTTDTAASAAFYQKALPWRTQPSSMPGYTIWMAGQTQIGGLMALPAEAAGAPPHWLLYVGTPNVDATCAQAQALGAKVHKPATDIPNVGRFAVLADPQGATFAVFTPGAGPPPGAAPPQGGFSWHELATTDVAAAVRFYGELFGWTKGPGHDMGGMGIYQLFQHAGSQVGGMCNVQGPSTPPSWLSYVHVADSNRTVAAVKAAGGRLLHGPMEVPGGSWIALFMDPQGGAFAVQEMPRTANQPKPVAAAAKAAAPPKPAVAPSKPAPAAPKPAAPLKPAAAPAAPAAKPAAPKAPAAKRPAAKPKPAKKKVTRKKAAQKPVRKARRVKRRSVRKGTRKPARKTARRAAPKKRARPARAKRKSARRRRR